MEKCTYCVQRIRDAEIEAEREDATAGQIRDGEIVTACQQACPSGAIVFGDLNDPSSRGGRGGRPSRTNYGLLAELNTHAADDLPGGRPEPEPRHAEGGGLTWRPRTPTRRRPHDDRAPAPAMPVRATHTLAGGRRTRSPGS